MAPVVTAAKPMADANDIVQLLSPRALGLRDAERWQVGRETVIPVTGERADFAVFGTETWLVEIKSARDSLRRLPRQAAAFGRIADRCVLVAASRHVAHAVAVLPDWWGLMEVCDAPTLALAWYRTAGENPERDRRAQLLMLRRREAAAAVAAIGGHSGAERRRMSLLAELDRRLSDDELAACVRSALARRHAPYDAGFAVRPLRLATHSCVRGYQLGAGELQVM
jgi:hypothetical protein